jgi:glycosyltransferase involved in cell wall biosynthesis
MWMCNEVPDLWHSHKPSPLLRAVVEAGRFADAAIVRSKNLTAVVADSRMAQVFAGRYGFRPHIVPYGIDGKFFAQAEHTPANGFRVIQPAVVSPSKCQIEVLEAAKQAGAEVIFAGHYEPMHPYTQQLLRSADGHATLAGHVSREQLRLLYSTSHVAVFAGKGQGSWLGPFEALAAGTPIIVSPNLTCSDLVREHDIGIVTDDIATALRRMRDDYTKYQEQARKGREFVLRELTWDRFGRRIEELMACGNC